MIFINDAKKGTIILVKSFSNLNNFVTLKRVIIEIFIIKFLILANFTAIASQKSNDIPPEIYDLNLLINKNYTLKKKSKPVIAKNWMVVTANKKASEAAAKILNSGGNAIDAMITAQLVLGLVEPESSGLGGGAFLVYYEKKTQKLTTLDGRETAPSKVKSDHFQNKNGTALKFFDAVIGGKSVGVPGTPALLEKAYKKWGKKKWEDLFKDPIKFATKGFSVSQKLSSSIKKNSKSLQKHKNTKNYFFPFGKNLEYGEIKKNINYANTLKLFSKNGSKVFYSGSIAEDIVSTVTNFKINPGILSESDLINYEVKERNPVCSFYREYKVCGMGPPSSGAISVNQILGIVEKYDLSKLGYNNAETWRIIGDASRLAFADRGKYIADSDFVDVPIEELIDKKYLKFRSRKLDSRMKIPEVKPGSILQKFSNNFIYAKSLEFPSTSHISIVDRYGNVLSMTSTIESSFGSKLMTDGGFLLNNEMTDFSFQSSKNGKRVANNIEPNKRPRSSMAPTIIFKNENPVFVIGSPGGSNIIGYVVNSIIGLIDWKMNAQQAASISHGINKFGIFYLEKNTKISLLKKDLEKKGYKVKLKNFYSGLNIIQIKNKLFGGSDHRREGIAIGN